IPNKSTSCYVSIADAQGEMRLAISDMQICEEMTPQFVADRLEMINDSALCVMDTNLPADTIQFLAEHVTVPLFADPVSTTKMHKLEPVLNRIHTLKPNRLEAELLTGILISDEASPEKAASALLAAGVHRVFISLGADGVFCADHSQRFLLPGIPTGVRSTTGGGDCFMAALACAYCFGHTLGESGRLALAAGAICAESEHTINEALSLRGIYERAGMSWPWLS
ncbi:MAG: PfkB family carbohydrate kinase, partial [Lachnospiraceae bacterium]|nr:PfkB family carbohydrate kinase [Lachnospiraceae bacterium]